MVIELNAAPAKKLNGVNHQSQHMKDQLAVIKTNLLNPAEVTFCNLSDESINLNKRRRLTTINSEPEDSDADSIISTSTVHPASTASERERKKKLPDGGYGWVIVFASLCISLIADGISFSFGLIYTELLIYFKAGTSKTAWIGSLFMAVPLLVGPIMSNLVDKYGCRKMTILGGLLGSTGFILASMSNSIEMLYITFGIIAGLGLGLGYVTAVVSIAFWFDKKRTFATGIGASGTGLGTFLYAPLTQWLLDTYGWRGATLILAGTLLNMCVCGALMRDPDWLIEENKLESRSQSIQTFSNSSVCLDEIKKLLETGAPKEDVLDTLVTNFNTEANQQILPDIVLPKKYQSEMILPTFINRRDFDYKEGSVGIRSSSRRSLRPDKLMSPETMSRDEFITSPLMTRTETTPGTDSGRNVEVKPVFKKDLRLASVETLSPSEKLSEFDHDHDFDTVSLNFSINDHQNGSNEELDEGYMTCRRSGMHGSRYSLNETLIAKPSAVDTFKDDVRRSFRGNSLDVVYENEIFNPMQNHSSPNHLKNKLLTDTVIPIPISTTKMRPTKKHSNAIPGNLKRNSSLRYSNYFQNMRVHRNSIHYRGALLNTHRYRLRASSCPNIYRNSMTTIAKEEEDKWYDDFLDIIKSIFDFSLFMQYKFGMMSMSTLILFTWYIVPYFYITEFLLKFDYTEEQSAYLISIIGIFNMIGMIFLGWIGDKPWLNVTKVYAACLFVCGLSVGLIPFATHSYGFLIFLCVLFGLTFASSFSFTPIILVRLVDLDDFTLAYGLILLVQGIGSLVGPPLAGAIFDFTNRWDDAFYAGGIFISISGFLAAIIGDLLLEEVEESEIDEDENNNNNDDKF